MYQQIDSNKRRTILLMTAFLAIIIGLGWFFAQVYNNSLILVIAVAFSLIQALISYYYSDQIALMASAAQEVPRKDPFMELHRIVENLSITAGIPKPKIYLIPDTALNAFATGRDPEHASIAVTQGLLERMNKQELEGVIAHELSHVKNYDIRLSTVVVVLVGAIALVSDWFMRSLWFRGRSDRENSNSYLVLIGIALAILAPIAATLIQLAISRKREYLADASGALLTRYPEGLAEALEVIAKDKEPLEVANRATAHLYIANPFKNVNVSSLFSTHPPIEDRIKKLRAMA